MRGKGRGKEERDGAIEDGADREWAGLDREWSGMGRGVNRGRTGLELRGSQREGVDGLTVGQKREGEEVMGCQVGEGLVVMECQAETGSERRG